MQSSKDYSSFLKNAKKLVPNLMCGLKYFLVNESQLEVFDIFMCKFDIKGFQS